MTNFDPKKLEQFLARNPNIEDAITRSVPEPKTEKTEDTTQEVKKSAFTPGHIILVPAGDGTMAEFRVRSVENEQVKLISLQDHTEKILQEDKLLELGAKELEEKKQQRISHPPVKDLFTKFNEKQGNSLGGLLAWEKEWINSGEIDKYRESRKVSLPKEAVEGWKKELSIYIKSLEKEGGISRQEAISNIGIIAKILSGATDDDMYAAAAYPPTDLRLQDLQKRLEGVKESHTDPIKPPTSPESEKKEPILIIGPMSGWPSIIKRNEKKGIYTYTANGKTEELPTVEWLEAENNVKPILEQYFKFLVQGGPQEQKKKMELFALLIEAKNDVIRALYEKEPGEAIIRAEVLRGHLSEADKKWKEYTEQEKEKEVKAKEEERRKKEEEKLARIPKPETFDRKASEQIKEVTNRLLHLGGHFFAWEIESIQKRIDSLTQTKDSIVEYLKKVDLGSEEFKEEKLQNYQKNLQSLQKELGLSKTSQGVKQVLRPTVSFAGARGSRISKQDMNTSNPTNPELLEKHRRMYETDPEGYLKLYRDKEYISGDQTKDVVMTILRENNISLEHSNEQKQEEKKDEHAFMKSFGSVYSPEKKGMVTRGNFETKSMAKESYTRLQAQFLNLYKAKESIADKETIAKLRVFNNEQGGGFRDENEEKLYKLDTIEHKIRILISKLSKLAANDKNYDSQYDGVEREIAKYAAEVEAFKNSLEEQLARYTSTQEEVGVEAAPDAPEKKMEERMKKVNALLEARKANLARNPKYMKKGRIRALLLALATLTAAGTAYDSWVNKEERAPEPVASSPETKTTWESYMRQDAEQKEYLVYFRKLPTTDLVKKCLSSGNLDLPKEICALTYDQLMDPNNPIPFLNDEQRLQLSKMVSMTENISQALDAPGEEWGRKTGKPVTLNSDRFAKGWILGEFFQSVRTKLAKVEQ